MEQDNQPQKEEQTLGHRERGMVGHEANKYLENIQNNVSRIRISIDKQFLPESIRK